MGCEITSYLTQLVTTKDDTVSAAKEILTFTITDDNMQLSILFWQMAKCGLSVVAHCRKLGTINLFCYIPIWWDFCDSEDLPPPSDTSQFQFCWKSWEQSHFLHLTSALFRHVRKIAKKMTVSFVMSAHQSVCPSIRRHGKTLLPLDGFS
jgi:hypothetical protein